MRNVFIGERLAPPPGPNEWLSDDIWNLLSRCWSPLWDGRPDAESSMNALNDAADAFKVKRRNMYVSTKAPSPFITKTPAGSEVMKRERKRQRPPSSAHWERGYYPEESDDRHSYSRAGNPISARYLCNCLSRGGCHAYYRPMEIPITYLRAPEVELF